MLSDLVAQIPASSAALDEDDESISDAVLASTSLSTTTATRRSATVKGWVHTLTGDTVLDELTLEHDQTRGRIPEAAKLAVAARTRLRAAAHAPSRPTVTCERCFIVIAPSGACGC